MALQHLRSGTANKRPLPTAMSDGQLAVNTNLASPGLFFKDGNGDLVKVGPVHIGSTAPNASPASTAATALVANTIYKILTVGTSDFTSVGAGSNAVGVVFTASGTTTGTGTVSGEQGNEKGEMWLDNTGGSYVFKIYDGTAWRSEVGEFVNATGDTMTGDLLFNNANIVFEGSAADDHETTLTVVNPTADRTITLPNVTGTVVTTGDTGSVTSTMLTDGTIVNADVNASAAIAGTKVSPDFGSQAITTTGIINANGKVSFPLGSAAAPSLLPGSDTNTGIFSPGADSLAITTAGTQRVTVDSSGRLLVNNTAATQSHALQVTASSDGNAVVVNGRASDDIGELSFYENDRSTKLGEIQYRQDQVNIRHRVGDIRFATGGTTERMRIDSSGNVGIGTLSPGYKCDIDVTGSALRLNSTTAQALLVISSDDNASAKIEFGDESDNDRGAITYDNPNNALIFQANAAERLRIDSSGRLLVGTSSNLYNNAYLQIAGTNSSNYIAQINTSASDGDGTRWNQVHWIGTQSGGERSSLAAIAATHDGSSDDQKGRIQFLVNDGNDGNSPTERLRIDSSGNVGIGTSSPSVRLDVQGAANSEYMRVGGSSRPLRFSCSAQGAADNANHDIDVDSSAGSLSFSIGTLEKMRIDSSGRVGIGNSSPSTLATGRLVIGDGSGFETLTIFSATNSSGSIHFADGTSGQDRYRGYITYLHTDNSMSFGTNDIERMRIDSSGRLLVGTTIAGLAGADELTLATSGSTGMTIRAGGSAYISAMYFADGTTTTQNYQGIIQYKHSTDSLQFYTNYAGNPSARMEIDSSGRLLVGTSSSRFVGANTEGLFQLEQSASKISLSIVNNINSATGAIIALAKSRSSGAGSTTVVQNNDQLGEIRFVGADGSDVEANAARISCFVDGTPGANDMPGRLTFSTTADGASSPTERMRISSLGRVSIGSTTNTAKLSIWENAAVNEPIRINDTNNTNAFTHRISFRTGDVEVGKIISNRSATSYGSGSDYRLKENVVDIADGISRVKQLLPKRFNFIVNADETVDGFIAHEAQTVVPEAVIGKHNEVDNDGKAVMQCMDQSKLVPLLTAALQEAIVKIETLEQRLSDAGIA